MNQELLERMNLIKQNNNNNFYQKYKENKVKLGGIKSYIENNVGSFDNLSNFGPPGYSKPITLATLS